MKKTMFKATFSNYKPEIKEVEVEKETDKSIWIGNQRILKESDYQKFFNSKDEAKEALTKFYNSKILRAKVEITEMEKNIKALREL